MRPGYEVRYAVFRDGERAYWLRHATRTDGDRAVGSLWFVRTERGRPEATVARRREFDGPPPGAIEAAEFDDVAWGLRVEASPRGYSMVPPLVSRARLVAEHPGARFSGTIRVGGETVELARAVGEISRLTSPGYSRTWAWAYGDTFDEPAAFEALGSGPLVSLHFEPPRRGIRRTGLLSIWGNRTVRAAGPKGWGVVSVGWDRRLRIAVEARPEEFVGVVYTGPRGERMHCYHTMWAEAVVEVFSRAIPGAPWGSPRVWRGPVFYEFSAREPVAGLAVHLPPA